MASSAGAAPFVFTNSDAISVPDNDTFDGPGPSTLEVTHPGLITRVEVKLLNVSQTRPADFDIIVEAPSGQFIYLMSDNCGVDDILNWSFNFADDHLAEMGTTNSSCGPVLQRPSDNFADTDAWTTAPGAVPVTTFAGLTGTNQTGEWRLHIADDTAGDTGDIGSGWEIEIDSTTPDALRIPSLDTDGAIGPIVKSVGGFPRTISDIDVQLNGLSHTYAGDLDFALESPAGTKVVFASDGCDAAILQNTSWIFDDEAATPYPDSQIGGCSSILPRFSPVNHPTNETAFGSVLTGGPFPSNLSAFDGQMPNGDWKLYINDDAGGDFGFINGFDLAITVRGAKPQTPSNPTFKFKKLGKKNIRATGRATLTGEALTAGECAGSVKSTFQVKSVRKKGKRKITSYKKVVAVNSNLTVVAGKCGFNISAKLPKKYAGKRLRLVTNYLGGAFIAPFTSTSTEKIKKLKF